VPAAHPADSELIRHAVAGQLDNPTLHHDIAERIYREMLVGRSAEWIVDKTPRYHHCLDYIARVMPEAKYFWIIRNPLDVAASYLTTWNNDVVSALRDGVDHSIYFDFALGFRRLIQFSQDHDVHLVRYEELVQSPASMMDKVFAHLGVASIQLQQDITSGLQPLLASAFGDVKIAQTKAVHSNSVDKYVETLGEYNSRLLCALLGRDLMDALGYAQYFDRHDAGSVEDASSLPERVYRQGLRLEKKRQSLAIRPYHYWQSQRRLVADYRVSLRRSRQAPPVDVVAEIAQLKDQMASQFLQMESLKGTMEQNQERERIDRDAQAPRAEHFSQQIQRLEFELAALSAAIEQHRAASQSVLDSEFGAVRQSMAEHTGELERLKAQMAVEVAKGIEQLSQLERKIATIQQSRLGRLLGWGSR